jgi:hypothetical protein
VSQASKRLFQYSRKILCRFPLREVGSHVSILTTQSKSSDAHQSATYVWTRWQNHMNAHQCLETSNYSRLHPFRRNGKLSSRYLEFEKILALQCIRPNDVLYRPDAQLSKQHPSGWWELSVQTFLCVEKLQTIPACICFDVSAARPDATVFNQLWDFFSKHRYEKTTATVRTMCVPVRTSSFIRQVVHSKSRRSDVRLLGPDAQASYMEIAYIRSTVRTTDVMVQTRQDLIWKLRAAKVQPSGS